MTPPPSFPTVETGPLYWWSCPHCGAVFMTGIMARVWDVLHPEHGKPCEHFQGIRYSSNGMTWAVWK